MGRTRRRSPAERAAAWVVTGPLGHLYSVAADVLVLWARYGASRVHRGRKGQRPARRRAL